MDPATNSRDRRIAERRERALRRLQVASSRTQAGSGEPTSCHTEKNEDALQVDYSNEFTEILEASTMRLYEFKMQNEPFSSPSEDGQVVVVADLCHLLREAAANLEEQSNELSQSFQNLVSIKNPMLLRHELQVLAQQAASAERQAAEVEATAASFLENKASHFVQMLERQRSTTQKAIKSVEKECIGAAAAMAEHASTTTTGLLQQLTNNQETRRAAIAAEIERVKLLESVLHEERVNKRQVQEKILEEMRKKEHAGHDELWHQLSSQATELALELSLAKHDRLFTADKLGYNVRVLGERQKENKEVLTELQRNVHRQKAFLATLRSQYADEKNSTSATVEKFQKDADHAHQSLNSLKDKALHFELVDQEELRQLIAFKEESLSKRIERLNGAQQEIRQLCGDDHLSSFGEIKLPPLVPSKNAEGMQINETLTDAHWRGKFCESIPQGLQQELKRLEAAIRQTL